MVRVDEAAIGQLPPHHRRFENIHGCTAKYEGRRLSSFAHDRFIWKPVVGRKLRVVHGWRDLAAHHVSLLLLRCVGQV